MAVLVAIFFICLTMFLKVGYDFISCYLLTPRRIKKIMEKRGIRGPNPRFLMGNISDKASLVAQSTSQNMESISHDIVGRLMPHYVAWSTHYGKIFIFWKGIEPLLCLTDTQLIKEFLSKFSYISGRSWLQQKGSKHFIGKGLLIANGDDWRNQRHIVAPAFTLEKLKSYANYMVECTEQMLQSLKMRVESDENEIEIGKLMTDLTADIISRTMFGSNYEKGKQILHSLTILQQLCAQANRRLCIPGAWIFPSKYNRKIKSLNMEVERLLMGIIQNREDCVAVGQSATYGDDLLGLLLNEMQKKKGSGSNLNLQLIMDECKTFFFAGHETTALLLTWTVMLLATNPSWQERVRAEVKQVCKGGTPSVHQLSKLTMLKMVINESLRLYPPVTLLPRMVFEDIKLGDLEIPKGLSIWIPVLAIHHSREIWGEDANEFRPDRFASNSFASDWNYLPFSAGPRNCIGQFFALMEARFILAMLILKFNFTISENYRHAPVTVLTIKPKHGVQIRLTPLND